LRKDSDVVKMASEEDIGKRVFEYVRAGQKLKLCILHNASKQEAISNYEMCEKMDYYYPVKLFTVNEAYEALKKEGFITYEPNLKSDSLANKYLISSVFEKYRDLIGPFLDKNYPGRGDISGTMDERYFYIIRRLFIRGGSASEETLSSDIQRDLFAERIPSAYRGYKDFNKVVTIVQTDLAELLKRRYIRASPHGYALSDFVFDNLSSDPHYTRDLFNTLSTDLWMAFDFEAYLSNARKVEDRFPKLTGAILEGVKYFRAGQFNDALDNLNSACAELTGIIYSKIVGEEEKQAESLHGKIAQIWKKQDLWREDPTLSEIGQKGATFLASVIFIPKWIRDKTSHPLATPTADSVRLALLSILIALDVATKLRLLD
jgi:hypothetical protein